MSPKDPCPIFSRISYSIFAVVRSSSDEAEVSTDRYWEWHGWVYCYDAERRDDNNDLETAADSAIVGVTD